MKVIINCGACPDLHAHDNVEAALLVRRDGQKAVPVCTPFTHGRFLLAHWQPTGQLDVFNSDSLTRRELETLSKSILHLAIHYPGKGLSPNEIKIVHSHEKHT